jgi:general secretion pathway protein D
MLEKPACFLAFFAAAASFAACGGGTSTPPPPRASVRFTPVSATAPPNSVTLRSLSTTTTTVTVEAVATGVTNVASVAFDLVFNPAVIKCSSATVGAFLASGGGTVNFALPPDLAAACNAGRVPVGITITPAISGVSGSGTLCSVTFEAVSAGTETINFDRAATFLPLALPNPGVIFEGGTVTVVQ